MQLINRTRFSGGIFVDLDADGTETLVLAVKATFEFGGRDEPRLASRQNNMAFADIYAGEPGASSLLYESDANWGRQTTDIAVMAHAYPRREGDRETDITVRVGALTKSAHVFGDRTWTGSVRTARPSSPKPFERIPLIYERAFGGTDDSPTDRNELEGEPRNPVGRGLRAAHSRLPLESIALPNVEDPNQPIGSLGDRPSPVGFTFVAKGWKPRSDFAGTYDAAWQIDRMPLLPKDFDRRFYTAASAGLTSPSVIGGEVVELVNVTASRRERFAIPRVSLQAGFHVDAAPTMMPMRLDSVVIDAVNAKLVMVWHGSHPVNGLVDDVKWVLVEESRT